MKTNRLTTLLICTAVTAALNAQIKVYPGKLITYGDTTIPYGVNQQFISQKTAFSANSSAIVSAPMIIGQNGYSSTASYTWWGDKGTGLSHSALGNIAINNNGNQNVLIKQNGWFSIGITGFSNGRFNVASAQNETNTSFNSNHTGPYGYAQNSNINNALTKNWAVSLNNGATRFYVAGAGWLFANGAYIASDQSFKEDIVPITNALSKILQLKGVQYKLKVEKLDPSLYGIPLDYYGIVAQDVKQVIPSEGLVRQMEDGKYAIQYHSLTAFLIEAMKEQNKRIDSLQTQLNDCCLKKNGNNGNGHRMINEANNEEGSWIKQNRPNPFNNQTIIEYNIVSETASASIMIFDVNGKTLKGSA